MQSNKTNIRYGKAIYSLHTAISLIFILTASFIIISGENRTSEDVLNVTYVLFILYFRNEIIYSISSLLSFNKIRKIRGKIRHELDDEILFTTHLYFDKFGFMKKKEFCEDIEKI